jgi:hypothetical protein
MVELIIETVECEHCNIETQVFARLWDHNDNTGEDWSFDLCPDCFAEAKKHNGVKCACCKEVLE